MNNRFTNQDFDQLVDAIRKDVPEAQVVNEAAARVRARLSGEVAGDVQVDQLNSCADFRALMPGYRAKTLSEARRMLVEDHLHTCVACRRVFQGLPASVTTMTPGMRPQAQKPRRVMRVAIPVAIAAAIVAVMGITMTPVMDRIFSPSGARGTVASVDGGLYRVSDQGLLQLASGTPLNEHDEIRTAKGSHAVIQLRDGSRIEMAERSALTLSERWSGKTVYLDHGSVMVEAAKQRRGRLEIITPDAAVSVKGTIFEVTRGTKGSRVSVVEGEVKVDQEGSTQLLHRGDQTSTSSSMTKTPVAEDVRWSENSAKYLSLLGELTAVQKKIEQIPAPALRYESRLAQYLPANTVVFASIPNVASVLKESDSIFEAQVEQSPVLKQWWNERETQQMRAIVKQIQTFGDYLGEEVVLAVPSVDGTIQSPIVMAEVRKPGLDNFLNQQFATLKATGMNGGPFAAVHGNLVALSDQATLARIGPALDNKLTGGFASTLLWNRLAESYKTGTGWILAADLEQIVGNRVHPQVGGMNTAGNGAGNIAGIDNVRFLVVERKDNLGRTENSATLSFSGNRHGLMSWLAAPGPMSTLDFVSPEASFATSFVIKNPGTLLSEMVSMFGPNGPGGAIDKVQQETGVNLLNDVAANLGGEMTVAFDGPLLPTPSWKVVFEVDNPTRLEWAFEQAVKAAQQNMPDSAVRLETLQVNGLTGHALKAAKLPVEIDYVFTNGYLVMGSSQTVLEAAIQTRTSGLTLSRSSTFRAQLPQDGHTNFSGIVYYNMGSVVGPMVDQMKKSGLMTDEQQKAAGMLASNREPGLIYAYGEPDRIVVASRSGFFGLDLSTLLGLNAKGAAAIPQLLPLSMVGRR